MSKETILKVVKTVLPLAIGVYLFWLFFSKMTDAHITSFKKALREANYFWIVLAMLLEFVSLWSRALRWKYLLEPIGFKTPWKHRYHALMVGYLANYTLPRAGEPTRSAMLYRSDGVPFAKSFGTIIAERAIDVIMLGLFVLITMSFGYSDLKAIFSSIEEQLGGKSAETTGVDFKQLVYFIVGGLLFLGVIVYILNKSIRNKLNQFIQGLLSGVFAIFKTEKPWSFVLHTFIIWISWLLMFIVPFYSLKETAEFPFTGMLIGFVVGSLGMSLTNGGIGIYPLLIGMVVSFYLKDDYPTDSVGIGNALGMIIWLGNTFIMILLGLISLFLLPNNYSNEDDTSRESTK
ncbi:MAG: flippase-like domain-containing protein [Crocinitomicaceae bacterium]|nr:flippase-like domain-containing protein [Crocinitomicaceae bacterium]